MYHNYLDLQDLVIFRSRSSNLPQYMTCDVRGEHAFCINSQWHSDPTELTLVHGQLKQKTCLYMHSTENQFQTPTKCSSIVSDPNKFAAKNFRSLQLSFRPLPVIINGSSLSQIFSEICKFKYRGLFFQEPTLCHFLRHQFYYFHDILHLCNCEKFALTISTLRINEI